MTVGRAQHVEPHLDCWAYRLDSADGSICYSGDSGGVCDDLIKLATNADVLIHMCHYLDGTAPSSGYARVVGSHLDAARVAQAAKVKTLVLSHQLEFLERPGVKEHTLHEVCRIFDGTVVWGEDLMVVPLKPHRRQVGA
jgi:ribonuclease BN (tRNA processing enzyme)